MFLPAVFDLRFSGFPSEAFDVLGRLRANPRMEQYRREKEAIRRHVMTPLKSFRDDLVVNVVLPNHLSLETERNVFSRLPKNDFGAGGSHSHVWMSFYRPGRSRLSDFQPFHGIDPDGFYSGLHVGGRDPAIVVAAREAFRRERDTLLDAMNQLLAESEWTFSVTRGSGRSRKEYEADEPMDQLPDLLAYAASLSIYRTFSRRQVVAMKGELVQQASAAMAAVWPFYEAFTE